MAERIQRALVSVSDKTGLVEFASALAEMGVEIISTGGTARLLADGGVNVVSISDYTGFPEIMDGRVKTLHPVVHGGLLAVRDNPEHVRAMEELDIKPIDMVCVNLYPFEQTVAKPDCTLEDAIENIDIGGPSMLRAAAKNHRYVTVVSNPARYGEIIAEMRANGGKVSDKLRAQLAIEVFEKTHQYDGAISSYLSAHHPAAGGAKEFPQTISLGFEKVQSLRYGENPHQKAAYYREAGLIEPSVSTAKQISGRELSFNNLIDINAAIEIVKEFRSPAVAVIKHTNPCGAGSAKTLLEAYKKAYSGDVVSAMGSIIGLNRRLDAATAEFMVESFKKMGKRLGASGFFIEAVIAPGYAKGAIDVLATRKRWGKAVRILQTPALSASKTARGEKDIKRVVGGLLMQDRDLELLKGKLRVMTKKKPTAAQMDDLQFAWTIAKHVKSNTILYAKGRAVVGVGAGQMSRVDAAMIGARKAGKRAKGAVIASDAFMPYPDSTSVAINAGVRAIIQPGGSKGDAGVIDLCNKRGVAMVFTGMRHFKH
ncbi:MAG: bifunctional phosphoribosylaminoimidazolecarboxamide formyltransferase/IMP cyclohydrolase [Phycisphaerae bacterium]|nr:bifunctional phosphoribosylaminoimidazolecarboxamide formyltransferase/IMP cyclohydrolase [Phycisphaerae bacterium]